MSAAAWVGIGDILPHDDGKSTDKSYQDALGSSLTLACEDNLTFLKPLPRRKFQTDRNSSPCCSGKDYETRMSVEDYIETTNEIF